MRRREFIAGLAATAWPRAARAQQDPVRRIGILMNLTEHDSEGQAYVAAFLGRLRQLGWTVGLNVEIDYRWTAGDTDRILKFAAELVALAPDVILTVGGSHVGPLKQATNAIPIVFVQVTDPVGGGFAESLARPGGNATGFTNFEFDISGKWFELLKQIVPSMTRTAVLRDSTNPAGSGQFGAIQAVARSSGVEVTPIGLRDADDIDRGLMAFARRTNGGLIITPSSLAIVHREFIVTLAARYRLPAIYPFRYFVTSGGLMSYGDDPVDQYRRAADYVDRILKGDKPAGLPVEQVTKIDLVINLKTAKALGLTIPETLLATADEVIQ
jgi:putative tryptophan/tyrosine transport system substrate-binding protein